MQALLIIVLIVEITFLYLWSYHRRKQKQLLKENGNLRIERDLVREHYTALNQYINLTETSNIDLKNQMEILDNLLNKNEGKKDCVNGLIGRSNICVREHIYCDEWMTNVIINHKVNLCNKLGIATEIEAFVFDIEWIEKSDFFSLLYNLFDNAIEACQRVKPEKKVFIRFRICEESPYLNLYMENTYQEILQSKGHIITTKKDKVLHGIGLPIIESIAQSYNGSVAMTYENYICITEIRLRKEYI